LQRFERADVVEEDQWPVLLWADGDEGLQTTNLVDPGVERVERSIDAEKSLATRGAEGLGDLVEAPESRCPSIYAS